MQNRCTTCPRPIPDTAYGCPDCGADLAQRLDQLAGFLPEIETTVARLDRIGSGGPRAAGAEIPLPYRPEAADKAAAIRGELTTWTRDVETESGRELRGGSSPALARYLASAVGWARYRQSWPEFHAALRPLFGSVLHLVDRPAEKVYLGPCNTRTEDGGCPVDCTCHAGPHYACSEPGGCGSAGCGRGGELCTADVYAKPGAKLGVCRACGAEHDVAESRKWLLGMLADQLFLASELSGILQRQGVKVGYSTITMYARQRRFLPRAQDGRMRSLYRLGDVVAVVEKAEKDRLERESERHARGDARSVA